MARLRAILKNRPFSFQNFRQEAEIGCGGYQKDPSYNEGLLTLNKPSRRPDCNEFDNPLRQEYFQKGVALRPENFH
jgi:hypothetical protein